MSYKRTNWVNNQTPLNADNLNNIEDGIEENKTSLNSKVDIASTQTITGQKTFTAHIKNDEIDNTNGNAMLRYKPTENKVVLGGSTIPTTIMGSGDRPTYSKNGSDFSGNELALKSDVDTNWNLLMDNLGIGRWRNTHLFGNTMYDDLAKYYTNKDYYLAKSGFYVAYNGELLTDDIHFNNPTDFFNKGIKGSYCFLGMLNTGTLYVPSCSLRGANQFQFSQWTKILVEDGCECYICDDVQGIFENCPNLTEIGAFDMSNITVIWGGIINHSPNVKTMHCKHWPISFDISHSTAFEEADLVEIISNLDEVTTTQTLTMGATNLAKLTDAEKQVATDKGWVLA